MATFVIPETLTDIQRRRGLRKMRSIALALLLFAAVVYVATHGRGGIWGYVNAAAEASMVGALADWFAVTALFRRPLGLPIPHTALIPERKDALGESLQDFVTANFLSEDVVRDKIARVEPSARIGGWLVQPKHSRWIVNEGSRVLRDLLGRTRDDDVVVLFRDVLVPRLIAEPLSPTLGHLLAEVVRDGAHHPFVDLTLNEVAHWLVENEETVTRVVARQAPWWSPRWVDDAVTRRVHKEALRFVQGVRDDPDHPARHALDNLLSELAEDLQHDADTMARAERLKERVLSHPEVEKAITSVWNSLRRALIDALNDADGPLRQRAEEALTDFGKRLTTDAALRSRLDGLVADAAGYVVRTYGAEISTIISDTVERWDGKEAADRIELHVGRDLQFIRINGTIVGGLAGLTIHAVSTLL
jgi:uncharacterized membrane-anchored protein YjiN (DUF445 family)